MSNTNPSFTELQAMVERGTRALRELAANATTDEEKRHYEARAEQIPHELARAIEAMHAPKAK